MQHRSPSVARPPRPRSRANNRTFASSGPHTAPGVIPSGAAVPAERGISRAASQPPVESSTRTAPGVIPSGAAVPAERGISRAVDQPPVESSTQPKPEAEDRGPTADDRRPKSKARSPEPELTPESVRANILNILLANPLFPKFYADTVIADRPNSKLAKALQLAYPKILDKVKSNMATSTCTHIKATGIRCGSPALRGEQFCYFHQRMHRGVRTPPQARLHPIANFEDEASIQLALMEVTNALMRNTIDLKRATLILRALHIAVKNASRVKYDLFRSEMVKEVPQYAAPTQQDAQMAHDMGLPGGLIPKVRTAAERAADGNHRAPKNPKSREELLADYYGYPSVEAYRNANVGADALVRPGGAAAASHPESQLPAHNFKTSSNPSSENSEAPQPANDRRPTTNDVSPRKPPATAKEAKVNDADRTTTAPAPKARKIAAHGASCG